MNTFLRFFYEFISIFFDGVLVIIKGFVNGLTQMINYKEYMKIINSYKDSFKGSEWLLVGSVVATLIIIFGLIIFIVLYSFRKLIRFRKNKLNQEDLLDEIADLDSQVKKLMKEKNEIMAMKVSQLGLNPNDEENPEEEETEEDDKKKENVGDIRFPKLDKIDQKYKTFKAKNYGNNFTLEEMLDNFKCYSASQLHLYYDASLLRAFFAGLACGKLVILQGL